MEQSELVCTADDIKNLKKRLPKMDFVDMCTVEQAHIEWCFYKLIFLHRSSYIHGR